MVYDETLFHVCMYFLALHNTIYSCWNQSLPLQRLIIEQNRKMINTSLFVTLFSKHYFDFVNNYVNRWHVINKYVNCADML